MLNNLFVAVIIQNFSDPDCTMQTEAIDALISVAHPNAETQTPNPETRKLKSRPQIPKPRT